MFLPFKSSSSIQLQFKYGRHEGPSPLTSEHGVLSRVVFVILCRSLHSEMGHQGLPSRALGPRSVIPWLQAFNRYIVPDCERPSITTFAEPFFRACWRYTEPDRLDLSCTDTDPRTVSNLKMLPSTSIFGSLVFASTGPCVSCYWFSISCELAANIQIRVSLDPGVEFIGL